MIFPEQNSAKANSDVGDKATARGKPVRPAISIVIPIYDEEGNIPLLAEALAAVLPRLPGPVEIIAVDDGSKDGSGKALREVAARMPNFKVISLRRNFGQTAALMAGVDASSGLVIVTMDADLQNDPEDIPALLAEMTATGADVVSGWRQNRQDAPIRRNFVSRVANRLISAISGVHLHDYGCTLKAYRAEVLEGLRLYGEMHRFVPIYASWMGARVTEMPVRHHARRFGRSKYGLERSLKVVLDLLVLKFFARYLVKPIYVFGSVGVLSLFCSLVAAAIMLYLKLVLGYSMILTPLPILSAMFFMVGIMCILMGILAEIMMRTYFESQNRLPYVVGERINFDEAV